MDPGTDKLKSSSETKLRKDCNVMLRNLNFILRKWGDCEISLIKKVMLYL